MILAIHIHIIDIKSESRWPSISLKLNTEIATRNQYKKSYKNEQRVENCNPEVSKRKGELQILGFRDESQHIVM